MKKKIICIAAAAALAAGLLAGCADKNSGAAGGQTDTASAGTAADTDAETGSKADTAAKISAEGTKFMVDGKEFIVNGVNTPWEYWNDFGTDQFDPEFWDSHFADLHDIGVNSVRVWVNCEGMVSIRLDKKTGVVTQVVDKHWEDVDKLFEIAEKHQIYLMPTLLSFDHFKGVNAADRWRMIATDNTTMQSYIDMYVIPFTERYGSNPYLLGIDLMNEPDWVHEREDCGQLSLDTLSNFFAKCTAAIHETNPDTLVTVGIGMIKYNSDKYEGNIVSDEVMKQYGGENACLDFYSVHYYNWMKPYWGSPYGMTPEEYGLDGTKPVFLGETNAEGEETHAEVYEMCYNNGWNGVMIWCSNSEAEHSDIWDNIAEGTKRIEELAPEKVFPLGKN